MKTAPMTDWHAAYLTDPTAMRKAVERAAATGEDGWAAAWTLAQTLPPAFGSHDAAGARAVLAPAADQLTLAEEQSLRETVHGGYYYDNNRDDVHADMAATMGPRRRLRPKERDLRICATCPRCCAQTGEPEHQGEPGRIYHCRRCAENWENAALQDSGPRLYLNPTPGPGSALGDMARALAEALRRQQEETAHAQGPDRCAQIAAWFGAPVVTAPGMPENTAILAIDEAAHYFHPHRADPTQVVSNWQPNWEPTLVPDPANPATWAFPPIVRRGAWAQYAQYPTLAALEAAHEGRPTTEEHQGARELLPRDWIAAAFDVPPEMIAETEDEAEEREQREAQELRDALTLAAGQPHYDVAVRHPGMARAVASGLVTYDWPGSRSIVRRAHLTARGRITHCWNRRSLPQL
jgi:hypothetical protein